jgi:hypothetical protein
MGPCVGSLGVDTAVKCGVWLQLLHKLSQVCWSVVMMSLPHS